MQLLHENPMQKSAIKKPETSDNAGVNQRGRLSLMEGREE